MARPRSRAPRISLEEVVRIARRVYGDYGGEASLESLSNVTGNSLSSSSFRLKLGNLKLFGILDDLGDEGVTLTDIGYGIAAPKSPQEEAEAVAQAFLNVPTYRDFHDRFNGKLLPDRERLPNVLHREMDIEKDFANEWADSIVADLETANLLDRRGGSGQLMVLSKPLTQEAVLEGRPMRQETQQIDALPPPAQILHGSGPGQRLEIGLSGGKGVVVLPDEVTPSDIDLLTSLLAAMKSAISGKKT